MRQEWQGWLEGIKKFQSKQFKKHEKEFIRLVNEGQHPKALFIGCSDSRVMPSLITSSRPGDLFILRNVGNFVPPFKPDNEFHATAAAIEYAVSYLEVAEIILCGHSDCGACKALFEPAVQSEELIHTAKWLELGLPAKQAALRMCGGNTEDARGEITEKLSIVHQLMNLMGYPGVARRMQEESLFLHGWYYRLESGEIEYFDPDLHRFVVLEGV